MKSSRRDLLAAAPLALSLACSEASEPVAAEAAPPATPQPEQKTFTAGLDPVKAVLVAGYTGEAVPVDQGQIIKITDVEGRQVGDLFAILRDRTDIYLCTFRSRTGNRKLFPAPGEQFVTLERQPILTFLSDHSPGIHDMLYATCDQSTYERLGEPDHPSCNGNFLKAVAAAGIQGYQWAPGPVNIFQNTPVDAEGNITVGPPPTKAGDFLEFRAEQDIYLVLTACSYDRNGFNNNKSTPLQIDVYEET